MENLHRKFRLRQPKCFGGMRIGGWLEAYWLYMTVQCTYIAVVFEQLWITLLSSRYTRCATNILESRFHWIVVRFILFTYKMAKNIPYATNKFKSIINNLIARKSSRFVESFDWMSFNSSLRNKDWLNIAFRGWFHLKLKCFV